MSKYNDNTKWFFNITRIYYNTKNINLAANYTNIIEPTISDATVKIALKFGDFKAMRLANFIPVGFIEEFFEILHFTTGLPWYYNTIHTYISFHTICFLFNLITQVYKTYSSK